MAWRRRIPRSDYPINPVLKTGYIDLQTYSDASGLCVIIRVISYEAHEYRFHGFGAEAREAGRGCYSPDSVDGAAWCAPLGPGLGLRMP